MKNQDSFAERRKTATAAKAALLEKFKARPADDDPEVMARAAARLAAAEAKEQARLAKVEAEKAAREAAEAEAAAQVEADAAAAKAARDARYAARKQRKQA